MVSSRFKVRLAFILLFGLIPYRVFGIFGIPLVWKAVLGLSFLLIFYFIMEEIVPSLLNSHLIQLFFFNCLRIEEYMCTANLFYSLLFAFFIPLEWMILAGNSDDPYFWYLLWFFLVNLYYRLKEIFLNPKFEGSIYSDLEVKLENNENNFTWDFVVLNMSTISRGLFKVPVQNQLSLSMSQRAFPFIAKRYIYTRFLRAINGIKGNPELVGVVGITASVTGLFYSEQKNMQRHRETMQVMRETSEASVKAQEASAMAQYAVANSQSDLARSQSELTMALNRLGIVQEKTRKQKEVETTRFNSTESVKEAEVKAPSLLSENGEELFSVLKSFFF